MCVYLYLYIYIYIYTHTYIHTHTHANIHYIYTYIHDNITWPLCLEMSDFFPQVYWIFQYCKMSSKLVLEQRSAFSFPQHLSAVNVINLLLLCQLQTPLPEKEPFGEETWKCFINNSAKDEQFISKLLPACGRWSEIWLLRFWLRVVRVTKCYGSMCYYKTMLNEKENSRFLSKWHL